MLLALITLTAFLLSPRQLEGAYRPSLALRSLDGSSVVLPSPYSRKHILLLFTPSCPHCRQVLTHFRSLCSLLTTGDVFAVSLGDQAPTVQLVDSLALPFPVLLDDGGSVRDAFDVTRVPVVLYVDDGGRIVRALKGARTFERDSLVIEWFNRLGASAGLAGFRQGETGARHRSEPPTVGHSGEPYTRDAVRTDQPSARSAPERDAWFV